MLNGRSHGFVESQMYCGWAAWAATQPFKRKPLKPSNRSFEKRSLLHLQVRNSEGTTSLRIFVRIFAIVNCMPRHSLIAFALLATLCSATFCPAKDKDKDKNKDKSKDKSAQLRSIHLDKSGKKWADKSLRKMSPEEKVGQLFAISVR